MVYLNHYKECFSYFFFAITPVMWIEMNVASHWRALSSECPQLENPSKVHPIPNKTNESLTTVNVKNGYSMTTSKAYLLEIFSLWKISV